MFEECLNLLFLSFILVIVYFVWKSTEVRRETQAFENVHAFGGRWRGFCEENFFSMLSSLFLSLSYYYYAVRRSSSLLSNASTASNSTVEDNLTSSVEELAQNIFTEASESFNALNDIDQSSITEGAATDDDDTSEQERIISAMDRGIEPEPADYGMRSRRRSSHNQNSREMLQDSSSDLISSVAASATTTLVSESDIQMIKDEDKIFIKLKYLNDQIKTVECWMNESVGNFKK
jgi:hypothetical protein